MIIGEIKKDEKTIKINTDIHCSNCGKTVPHDQGMPCVQITCPECGQMMDRE